MASTYAQESDSKQSANEINVTKNAPHSLQDKEKNNYLSDNDYVWMKSLHQSISNTVYQSAVWFDNFFIDENIEQSSPKAHARIRLGWEPKASDLNDITSRFKVKVHLPHFKDKVDLILSDDEDFSQNNLPLGTQSNHQDLNEENFEAAIRYTHRKEKNRFLETRVGISGGDIFVRSRIKRRFNVENAHSFKIEPSIYYFLNDGLGAKLLLEYDYQLHEKSQFRINYSIRASESFKGIRWKHGFYKLTQLQQQSASIIGLQVEGERAGENGFIVDKYTLSYRYRFNALKSWLFFEIEPFIEWEEEMNYDTTPGIALRVEGHFSKG